MERKDRNLIRLRLNRLKGPEVSLQWSEDRRQAEKTGLFLIFGRNFKYRDNMAMGIAFNKSTRLNHRS